MLAFMQQYLHKKAGSVSLFITSDNHTIATVYIPGVNNFRQEIHLQPDELVRVDLPINARLSGKQWRWYYVDFILQYFKSCENISKFYMFIPKCSASEHFL